MEIPSTSAGIVREISVKVGDKISCGGLLVLLEQSGDDDLLRAKAATPIPAPSLPAPISPPTPMLQEALPQVAPPLEGKLPHASPSVRRFAREFGIDLAQVNGTGPKGRIVHGDLQAFVKAAVANPQAPGKAPAAFDLLPWPQIDFAKFGPIERVELSKIKKISGANLQRNAIVIPHVTNFDEADVTDLEAFRVACNKDADTKLTMLAFLIKASVTALKEHPTFNASVDGDHLVLKRYFHVGFAADTPNGLVVPVIRDADSKGLRANRSRDLLPRRAGPRRQAQARRHAGRHLHRLLPLEASAAPASPPSSTRPRSPSSAQLAPQESPCGMANTSSQD